MATTTPMIEIRLIGRDLREVVDALAALHAAAVPDAAGFDSAQVGQDVLQVEQDRINAIKNNDADTLSRIMADDFTATGPYGETITRDEDLGNVRAGNFHFASITTSNLRVRANARAAVITGGMAWVGKFMTQDISNTFSYTAIYFKQASRWRLVTLQFTILAPTQQFFAVPSTK